MDVDDIETSIIFKEWNDLLASWNYKYNVHRIYKRSISIQYLLGINLINLENVCHKDFPYFSEINYLTSSLQKYREFC